MDHSPVLGKEELKGILFYPPSRGDQSLSTPFFPYTAGGGRVITLYRGQVTQTSPGL